MSIVLQSTGGGQITLQEPATASNFTQTLPAATGTVVISGTTPTLNGITFPATQVPSADANTLDDYEEGTFTPVYSPQGGAFTTLTYFAQTGKYTKIGNFVFFEINVFTNIVTVGTASGEVNISGLPFTADATAQLHPAPALGRIYRWANAIPNIRAYVGAGSTFVGLANMATNAANATNVQVSDMTTGANTAFNCLDITGCYKIA